MSTSATKRIQRQQSQLEDLALTGIGPNLTYTPDLNYEGTDSFSFAVCDGVWSNSASDTIFVVAGPVNLTAQCDADGHGVLLDWSLDDKVQQMIYEDGLSIYCYQIYRSATPGGPYVNINHHPPMILFKPAFWTRPLRRATPIIIR